MPSKPTSAPLGRPLAAPRRSGVLLHPTSLPGATTEGPLGPPAFRFVDWLSAHGQSIWQMLPVGPPGFGGSPYSSHSSNAGDPHWVSPHGLAELGLVDLEDRKQPPPRAMRREAWRRHRDRPTPASQQAIDRILDDRRQSAWIEDWALFAALKAAHQGQSWVRWESDLIVRDATALHRARLELDAAIDYQRFLQAAFLDQWERLHQYAAERGILLLGDLPFYPALDSVDVWCHRDLFSVRPDGRVVEVGGVPPDDFTDQGQLWGQPTFRWAEHQRQDFGWWIQRVDHQLRRFDSLRLDHFRGFVDYWAVPAEAETAIEGRWSPGPGSAIFRALYASLGSLPLVAEDLGVITEAVESLRREIALPGIRVLQFAVHADSPHRPARITPDHIVYTGTHDNPPTRAWYQDLGRRDRATVRALTGGSGRMAHRDLAALALETDARWAILPMQDVLGLRRNATLNRPGTLEGNWQWQLEDLPARQRTGWFERLTETTGRSVRRLPATEE